jgi:hypothetical protein
MSSVKKSGSSWAPGLRRLVTDGSRRSQRVADQDTTHESEDVMREENRKHGRKSSELPLAQSREPETPRKATGIGCPTEALKAYAGERVIRDLLDVGLIARAEQDGLAGVVVVDYAEFNETKPDIDDRLQRDRIRKDRTSFPRGIRSDSHPHSAVKPVEKSSVEKDLISDL